MLPALVKRDCRKIGPKKDRLSDPKGLLSLPFCFKVNL